MARTDSIDVDVSPLLREFSEMPEQIRGALRRAVGRAARIVHADAVLNAPKSPTKEQYESTLRRKKHSDRRRGFNPGGLERSIRLEKSADGLTEVIFIASNSEAGAYAKRIHDEKHVTWFRRGIGTQQKGDRADEKFISRAMDENAEKVSGIITGTVEKELKRYA